jgi:hypothetical protein
MMINDINFYNSQFRERSAPALYPLYVRSILACIFGAAATHNS